MHVPHIRLVQTAQPECMWVQGECWFPQPWSSHGSLLQWGCDVPSFNIPWLYNRRWVMSWGTLWSSSPSVCLLSYLDFWRTYPHLLPAIYLQSQQQLCECGASHVWRRVIKTTNWRIWGNLLPLCEEQVQWNISGAQILTTLSGTALMWLALQPLNEIEATPSAEVLGAVPNHCKFSPAVITAQIWWWEASTTPRQSLLCL